MRWRLLNARDWLLGWPRHYNAYDMHVYTLDQHGVQWIDGRRIRKSAWTRLRDAVERTASRSFS